MKVIVYTINDCVFSKQEKEYLASHNISFDEKNLETNREFLTEMLALSNNFAGTPVTKVEKDDGQIVVLKGFAKEEFDQTFGLSATKAPTTTETQSQMDVPPKPVLPQPKPEVPPVTPTPPLAAPEPTPPTEPPAAPTTPQPIVDQPLAETPKPNDALNNVLNDLQTKANEPAANPTNPPTNPPSETPVDPPKIPDFQDK